MCLGLPGQIVELVDLPNHIAKVDVSGVKRNINVGLLKAEEAQVGNWVLIHVGFALSQIDQRARAQFQESIDTPARFFEANADTLAQACFAMAQRFERGGSLLVLGGASS